MSEADAIVEQQTQERPRLQLKPRDPAAVAKIEAERQHSLSEKSPFGAAKPREQVIAVRVGKSEREILLDEVKKEKLHLRLDGAQLEEKRAIEAELKDLQGKLDAEEDADVKASLTKDVDACRTKLDDLIERFAKATLDNALSGEAPRVSNIRRQQQQTTNPSGRYNPTDNYPGQGPSPNRGGYDRRGGFDRGQPQRYNSGGHYRDHHQNKQEALPEWARDGSPPQGAKYQGGAGFERQTSGGYHNKYQQSTTDGYGDSSDSGFFDQPTFNGGGFQSYSGGGRANGRGRGRAAGGRGGFKSNPGGAGYYGGGGGGTPGGYNAPGGVAKGVGGEIDYDDDSYGDRY